MIIVLVFGIWVLGFYNETSITTFRDVSTTQNSTQQEMHTHYHHHHNGDTATSITVGLITNDDIKTFLSQKDLYTMKKRSYNGHNPTKSNESSSSSESTKTKIKTNRYCYRYCTKEQLKYNKILYAQLYPIIYQAGLNDRIIILDALSNLASYLCAGSVEIPRPYFHLHPMHNTHNKPVDISLKWNDYMQFTNTIDFIDPINKNENDAQPQQSQSASLSLSSSIVRDMDNPINYHKLPDPTTMYREEEEEEQDNKIHRVITETCEQVVTDFQQVELLSFNYHHQKREERQQQEDFEEGEVSSSSSPTSPSPEYFIWEIQENYWFFLPNLRKHLRNETIQRRSQRRKQRQGQRGPVEKKYSNETLLPPWLPLIDSRQEQMMNDGECRYVVQTRPYTMEYVIDRIWNEDIIGIDSSKTSRTTKSSTTRYDNGNDNVGTTGTTTTIIIIYLHIRRTDTINVCNTTLQRMESYLDCSLSPLLLLTQTQKISISILFGSDEMDMQYRARIHEIIRRISDDTIRFISIDDLVRQRVDDYIVEAEEEQFRATTTSLSSQKKKAKTAGSRFGSLLRWKKNKKTMNDSSPSSHRIRNTSSPISQPPSLTFAHKNNYYLFEIQNAIMERADFRLEQHRGDSCNDCDPIYLLHQ